MHSTRNSKKAKMRVAARKRRVRGLGSEELRSGEVGSGVGSGELGSWELWSGGWGQESCGHRS